MKFALASVLLTACAQVVQPADDNGRKFPAPNLDLEISVDEPDDASQPLAIGIPKAASSSTSLFAMTFLGDSPMSDVILADTAPRPVVEQRIVTMLDEEVDLAIELAPPTGTFSRVIVGDVVRPPAIVAESVVCKVGNFSVPEPKCKTANPVPTETASDGPITASQWKLAVVDEQTGSPLSTCSSSQPNRIECVLPPRAGIAYRIVASANGFANLWDGTPSLREDQIEGAHFTGAFLPFRHLQCTAHTNNGSNQLCTTRNEFTRYVALDRATLSFDPISLRISANGEETEAASPALAWDPGSDDVFGGVPL